MSKQIIKSDKPLRGSPAELASREKTGLTEILYRGCRCLVVGDNSGSMLDRDAPGNITREKQAVRVTELLYKEFEGQFLLIEFSDKVEVWPTGTFSGQHGGTALELALQYLLDLHADEIDGMKIIVVSDGLADWPDRCLELGAKFKIPIQTIHCGSDSDQVGRAFLTDLAKVSKGTFHGSDVPGDFEQPVRALLEAGTK